MKRFPFFSPVVAALSILLFGCERYSDSIQGPEGSQGSRKLRSEVSLYLQGDLLGGTYWVPADKVCVRCHGGHDNNTGAPPYDLYGDTLTTFVTVGAHTSHLSSRLSLSTQTLSVGCVACHIKPSSVRSPGHIDPYKGDNPVATVTFGSLASGDGSLPNWNRTTAICANVYCHGATLSGATSTQVLWTKVDGSQTRCGTCHGLPPNTGAHSEHTEEGVQCASCHGDAYTDHTVDPAIHINGIKNLMGRLQWDPKRQTCSPPCHETENWYGDRDRLTSLTKGRP